MVWLDGSSSALAEHGSGGIVWAVVEDAEDLEQWRARANVCAPSGAATRQASAV